MIATGVNDGAITSSCTPRIAFTARPIGGFGPKTLICESESVNYVDFSFNYSGPITREWTFAGGTPATSNDSTPAVVYSTPGVHDVTLKITTANGDVSLTKSKYIVVDPINAPSSANFYSFGFEDANSFNNDWVIQDIGEDANNLFVSSTKSMTGHLLGAAGGIEAIACILSICNNFLPPTIHYETPDIECDLNYVANRAIKRDVDYAMSNTFGFGGHNATLILKSYNN